MVVHKPTYKDYWLDLKVQERNTPTSSTMEDVDLFEGAAHSLHTCPLSKRGLLKSMIPYKMGPV